MPIHTNQNQALYRNRHRCSTYSGNNRIPDVAVNTPIPERGDATSTRNAAEEAIGAFEIHQTETLFGEICIGLHRMMRLMKVVAMSRKPAVNITTVMNDEIFV